MIFLTNLERVEAEKLADVTIGEPIATSKRTVEDLVAEDIVGVYRDNNVLQSTNQSKYMGLEAPLV